MKHAYINYRKTKTALECFYDEGGEEKVVYFDAKNANNFKANNVKNFLTGITKAPITESDIPLTRELPCQWRPNLIKIFPHAETLFDDVVPCLSCKILITTSCKTNSVCKECLSHLEVAGRDLCTGEIFLRDDRDDEKVLTRVSTGKFSKIPFDGELVSVRHINIKSFIFT